MRVQPLTESLWLEAHGDADSFMAHGGGMAIALGTLLAVLSAVANGTFTIFSKTGAVRRARVDPVVFNLWACVGIVLSSLLTLVMYKFVWSYMGLISGLLFVLSASNSYRAVRLIGVSVGTGIWCGTAVLVSFVAGLVFDPNGALKSKLWALVAIIIIMIGIVGVAYAGHVGRVAAGHEENLDTLLQHPVTGEQRSGTFSTGVFTAIFAGLAGGLIMIPLTRASAEAQGIPYLPSFAIGVAIFAPIVTAIPYVTRVDREMPNLAPAAAALPGIVSGIVWNIGNVFSILAIGYISYSIAYPM
ncbi:hypothetical protein MPTK1_5g17310 [Marchantia polymorpha subsp. ruderalis]|uniref:Uncharacterized protein n=2 Tax=Marchantia polymorpha TaxID=3197 RepID=A0AAF6BJA9_MARPO|nr:hypothetical protein MARPO_0182s0018 [Marchantia polymorpha]BBN12093.1 hypothetical protein Mp_5g17310 [Marchantia polymorpha subsp. ruderalis]|eukprot:PTQ27841.1 hypothetical protein MARPO_0182s0018 [Marchantia polymorpha]